MVAQPQPQWSRERLKNSDFSRTIVDLANDSRQLCHLKIRIACGGIAQLGEHLICIQKVAGSIPVASTTFNSAF